MDFVTIEFDRELGRWSADLEAEDAHFWDIFEAAAKESKLRWDGLDMLQQYCFKLVEQEGRRTALRFLGVEARWGEYVPATQDQLILGSPA